MIKLKIKKEMFQSSGEDLVNNDELNAQTDAQNEESAILPYPKRVFFIIGNEFCERFNYFGMKGEKISIIFFNVFIFERDI